MRTLTALAAALLLAVCGTASAGPVTTGQWYTFGFGGPGSALERTDLGGFVLGAESLALDEPPWTITLPGDAIMTVVDGFISGDNFEILDFGAVIGTTSLAVADASTCSNSEAGCLADPEMSRGFFALAAGDHSLTGAVVNSPFGSGAAFFRIDLVSVPEAATLSLLGLGLLGLGLSVAARGRRA